MENAKRGFVFYFDNYFVVEDLPRDQRGWLLSALCVYAERVCVTDIATSTKPSAPSRRPLKNR